MNLRVTAATARRVAGQLRGDPRTLALIFVVPPALLALFKYVFNEQPQTFDRIGPPLIGLFPLVVMFLITSIAMLRERTTGTLERLMSMPLAKLDILLGYGTAFAVVAAAQACVTAAVAYWLLNIHTRGSVWAVIALAVANSVLGMALGLFLSAFASTEFQAVQFMPAFVLPQILLSGLLVPRDYMPSVLRHISDFLPFTYSYDALARAAAGSTGGRLWFDVGVIVGSVFLALALGAATLRRRTA
jgi:ABC-2 type transport system permease protein